MSVDNKIDQKAPVVQEQSGQPLSVSSQNTTQAQTTTETPEQINWKKFREQRELERKAKEDAERTAIEERKKAEALKAALEAVVNKPMPQQNQSYDQVEDTDDQKLEKKIAQALEKERYKVQQEQVQREQAEFPKRLLANFTDFNEVCTTENLDYLEYHHPEVAEAIKLGPDGYDKWAAIYKNVKKFVVNTNSQKEQKQADKNLNKPVSMSRPGMTPTGDSAPHVLTEQKRRDNWARMNRVMRSGGK